MTVSYDQHLVQTFYITKPQIQSIGIDDLEESKTESKILEERTLKKGKTVKFGSTPQIKNKGDPQCERILKMIKHQLSPSAEVRTKLKSRSKNSKIEKNYQFLSQFEAFFKGFIKTSKLDQEYLRKKSRKNTKKKTTTKILPFQTIEIHNSPSQSLEESEEEDSDFFIKEEPPKLNYHQRMKQKIQNKMESFAQHQGEKKMHKVQMKDKRTSAEVGIILNLKNKSKKVAPKLRIIRSGLPITMAELDPKAKNNHQGLLQNSKAKKDHGFYKMLQKNCEVILSEISNFEQAQHSSNKISREKALSRSRSAARSYLRDTITNSVKKQERFKTMRRSLDDEDQLKWKTKCKEIQMKSTNNLKKSRKLGGGLKVFEKYCNFVNDKWEVDQHRIKTLLAQEPHPPQQMPFYPNF